LKDRVELADEIAKEKIVKADEEKTALHTTVKELNAQIEKLKKRKARTMTFLRDTRAREEQADHYFQEMMEIADEPLKDNVEAARARRRWQVGISCQNICRTPSPKAKKQR
jgi:predicted  nucleic acid-binding Zn-ribbon protein